jgi:hypothetical protein
MVPRARVREDPDECVVGECRLGRFVKKVNVEDIPSQSAEAVLDTPEYDARFEVLTITDELKALLDELIEWSEPLRESARVWPPLVAIVIRCPVVASKSPSSRSQSLEPYVLAVSTNVTPTSRAVWSNRVASDRDTRASSEHKRQIPRPSRETSTSPTNRRCVTLLWRGGQRVV